MDAPDPSLTPEGEILRIDNQLLVRDALEQLPAHLREVLLLCDVEEFKYKEVAAVLDVPIGTVMSRLSRARHALRNSLKPQSGGKS
jgi:RNA polymerase sigma-70 factor (ECF subfamily)